MAKRNDWINAGGAVPGNPARGQGNGEKRGGYQNKRLRVRRLHAKQQAGHEASQRKRSREPEPHTQSAPGEIPDQESCEEHFPAPHAMRIPISRVRWLTA